MAVINSYNDIINRIGGNFWLSQPIWGEHTATSTTTISTNDFAALATVRIGDAKALPSGLPTGVSAYVPTRVAVTTSVASQTVLVCKMVNLGSIDISGASGTFTDGSVMPTVTELGVSRVTASPVMMEVTTALNATPGTLTITYTDQDGNSTETTAAHTLTASATVRSVGTMLLNTTDWGVQDITAAARAAGTTPTGVIKFWGIVPIAMLASGPGLAGTPTLDNLITSGFSWLRLGSGDTYGCFAIGSNGAKAIVGDVFFVGDS